MGIAALIALLVKAVPSIAGWSVNPLFPAATIVVAGVIIAVGLASKHGLTGRQRLADALSELASAWRDAQQVLPAAAPGPHPSPAPTVVPVVPPDASPHVLTPNPVISGKTGG
jgi:hypothetical protein